MAQLALMSSHTSQSYRPNHTGCVAAAHVYTSINNRQICAFVHSVDRVLKVMQSPLPGCASSTCVECAPPTQSTG